MKFRYYNPAEWVPIFKRNLVGGCVCWGCVFTGVSPEYCFHEEEAFEEPKVQSDPMCAHCTDTANEYKIKFHFHTDGTLADRVAELEEIRNMAG
jgi:hypothetical protein